MPKVILFLLVLIIFLLLANKLVNWMKKTWRKGEIEQEKQQVLQELEELDLKVDTIIKTGSGISQIDEEAVAAAHDRVKKKLEVNKKLEKGDL